MNNKILFLLLLIINASHLYAMNTSEQHISITIINDLDLREETPTGRLVYQDFNKLYPEKKSVPQNNDPSDIIELRKKWQKIALVHNVKNITEASCNPENLKDLSLTPTKDQNDKK